MFLFVFIFLVGISVSLIIFSIYLVMSVLSNVLTSMQVYIIDFGLAKKYRDLQTHKHIPYRYQFILQVLPVLPVCIFYLVLIGKLACGIYA